MELVADRLWLASDGTIAPYDGDMDDYARFVIERAKQAGKAPTQVREAEPVAPAKPPPATRAKAPTGTARRRAEAAEASLARASQALARIDAALTDPKVFSENPAKAAELGRQRAAAEAALEAAEQEWLEATEAYEAMKGEG